VQLVDATTGAHLWAENYERSFSPEAIFELQDELVPRIVSTVADQYGALVHSMSESLRGKSAGEYSAHEAVLRAFGYWERNTREEHAEVREILEAALPRRAVVDLLGRICIRLQREAGFTRPRPCCGAASGRIGADQPLRPLRIGYRSVLPEGFSGFPRGGGPRPRAESHGFLDRRTTRNDDRFCR
jgi:hypothetical protein